MNHEDYIAVQNASFSKKIKKAGGLVLANGVTPIQKPVTLKTGLNYKVTLEYLCNLPGCRIHYNIYKSPTEDFTHRTRILDFNENFEFEKLTLYLACPDVPYTIDAHIRLWSMDRGKRIYIRNVNVETTIAVPKEEKPRLKRMRRNNLYSYQSQYFRKDIDINFIRKEKLELMNLKAAPISFFSFIKNEGKYYLERMIKSILPYVNELIIVDTGSTDNTNEIIKKYQSKGNLRYYSIPCSEKELYKSINEGLAYVNNKWIFIIAGDEAMLLEDLLKIPPLLEEIENTKIRTVKVSYHDFIKDDRHYHTLYHPTAFRIWRNTKGFHFGGDYQGDIYMGYEDGIRTGGVETKKNMPPEYTTQRLDIFFHHYARMKPKQILLEKRIKYYKRRMKGTEQQILEKAKSDPFYTLDFGEKIKKYNGKQAGIEQIYRIGFYTESPDYAHFARPILAELRKMGHIVMECYDSNRIKDICEMADWVWVEWGEYWVNHILTKKHQCKVIVRIHRYEINKQDSRHINWNNADLLWFVNKEVMRDFKAKFPDIKTDMIFVPNAVDMSTLTFEDRNNYGKKICMYSTRFGGVKDYPTAIKLFKKLQRIDKEFTMLIRADARSSHSNYEKCKELSKGLRIKYDISPVDFSRLHENDDINILLKDKDIVLSTSKYESFHYVIPEALSKGCQVFVRGWDRGGRPEDFWSPYVCNSMEEMINRIISWSKLSIEAKRKISRMNRRYVEKNFGVGRITKKLINALENNNFPHVGIVVPVYNNEKYLEDTLKSLLDQTYKCITIIVVNDGSTDRTSEILEKYKNRIVILNVKHGGAHNAMSEGLKFLKDYGVDYTIMFGSDDIANNDYVESMVELAEDSGLFFVYPNFNQMNENGMITNTFIAQEPKLEPLRNITYFCDHSLVSAKYWDWYGWELRVKEFQAYSIFHAYASIIKKFPDKVKWLDKVVWNYRDRSDSLHRTTKGKRKGQRTKAVKDIFGD